ncbi:hypothetical protein Scep_009485 [Stephania cephalantha]|uniref:Uncharacterized protein n=1 Tax=Stephania cephalantha TaxID=152367 RepID=A0AAP0JU30_9MAGN
MEGLSHLGVQCTPVRDRVDDSDEQRRGLHRQRRQRAKASEAATTDGEGFGGSDGRWRGLRRQRRHRAKASEAATADDTSSGRPDDNSQSQSQRRQRP